MFIAHISGYIPEKIVLNSHFTEINGLTDEWILARTGIETRRKASESENTNSLAVEALKNGLEKLPFPKENIDL
ncbi:MAG: ketoacyl-ACP synthase III, partial [Bacteroidetes bacterium]